MEQHPIPQDITGFQFKLIGSMTVKQFGFVITGVIAAVILYYLPLNFIIGFLIKMLFIPLFGASGFIVAFVPIEGRPIDLMAMNFIKAVLSPNQYVYHKVGRQFSFSKIKDKPLDTHTPSTKSTATTTPTYQPAVRRSKRAVLNKNKRLQAYLRNSRHKKNKLDEKEDAAIAALSHLSQISTSVSPQDTTFEPQIISGQELPVPHPSTMNTSSAIPSPSFSLPSIAIPLPHKQQQQVILTPPPPPVYHETKEEKQKLEEELRKKLHKDLTPPLPPHEERIVPVQKEPTLTQENNEHYQLLQKQLEEAHSQKQQLEDELTKLRNRLDTVNKTPVTPTLQQEKPKESFVRNIPQPMSKSAGLAYIPDTPNVVVGIIKDSRGNVLPSILVEIKDKDGNPVRAFKSNALGQFASATPLSSGTYTIELEDPKKMHAFDTIQITAKNEIISPIEIISHDAREELRKALFN